MKEKGFTLVELLGVVTILTLLGLIVVPVVNGVISSSKRDLYDTQIRNIKSGASNFIAQNLFSVDIPIRIKLGDLKNLGFVDSNISNPITHEKFSDDLIILITGSNNSYEYTVCTASVYCDTDVPLYGE